jgi:protease II
MKSVKLILTLGLIVASFVTATAANTVNSTSENENAGGKSGLERPAVKPATGTMEKNTNAKFIAKQLTKLVASNTSANTILEKSSDVLERYGYHTASNGSFFSSNNVSNVADSRANLAITRSERGDYIKVKVESNKNLEVSLINSNGASVSIEVMNLGENEIFITPSNTLVNGEYVVLLKSKTTEKRMKLVVEQRELLGKK